MVEKLPIYESRWEVRPTVDRNGNVTAYDICLPAAPESKGVAVVATVFAGKEVADEIAWQHNTPMRRAALREMVRLDEEFGLYDDGQSACGGEGGGNER